LPKEMLENNPWLLYWKGAVRFPFNPSRGQSHFEKAFEQFKIQDNLTGALLAWSGVVDSIFYAQEDYSLFDRWIQIFPELPENPEKVIPPEVWTRVVTSMFVALLYRQPDHPKSEEWISRVTSIAEWTSSPLVRAHILFHMTHWYLFFRDYEQSSIAVRSLLQLAQSKDALSLVLIMARLIEVEYYQIIGDHEKCLKAASEGLTASENTGISFLDFMLIGHTVSSCQNVGDLGMAQTMLEKMASPWNRFPPIDKAFYHLCQARQFLLRSDLPAASSHAELALKTSIKSGHYMGVYLSYVVSAQIMHGIGKQEEAWSQLNEASRIAKRIKSKRWEYSGLMTEAHFHFEQGNEASGLASLRKALAIGKDRGFLNTFVDQPAVTAKLCIKALEEGMEVPYVQDIIRKRRLIPEKPPLHLENWPWPLKIYALGKFEIEKDDKPLQFSGKVPKRPLLLLKALIAQGGKDVKEEQLSDMLWPEADGDQAHSAFTTTLSRLRQLIGTEKAIEFHEGRGSLNPRYCWVDSWAFERIFEQIEAESKRAGEDETREHSKDEKIMSLIKKAISLYKGHFLADEAEEFWTTSYRERLRNKYLILITRLGNDLQKIEQWEKAVENYERALEVDNLAEKFYQRLMICYRHLGQHAKAIEVYKRCRKMLTSVLGIEPSPKTEAVYKTLVGKEKLI